MSGKKISEACKKGEIAMTSARVSLEVHKLDLQLTRSCLYSDLLIPD